MTPAGAVDFCRGSRVHGGSLRPRGDHLVPNRIFDQIDDLCNDGSCDLLDRFDDFWVIMMFWLWSTTMSKCRKSTVVDDLVVHCVWVEDLDDFIPGGSCDLMDQAELFCPFYLSGSPWRGALLYCLEHEAVTRDGLFVSDSECYPPK